MWTLLGINKWSITPGNYHNYFPIPNVNGSMLSADARMDCAAGERRAKSITGWPDPRLAAKAIDQRTLDSRLVSSDVAFVPLRLARPLGLFFSGRAADCHS